MTRLLSTNWFVAQTRLNSENKAAYNLVKQGYEAYVPRYLKRRRHARKTDYVAAPLFPRYVFIGADPCATKWRSIQSTFGVTNLVTNGDRPASVPDAVIRSLVQREDDKGFIKIERSSTFAYGDKVKILAGAFIESLGLFESSRDGDRVAILLDFLGQKVRVLLEADLVVAA